MGSPSSAAMRAARGDAGFAGGFDSPRASSGADDGGGLVFAMRDEAGDFTPSHKRPFVRPTSILKGSAAAAAAPSPSPARRGITFADQHGHELRDVRFSDRLHYSEGSEHVDWAAGPSCSVA